MKGREGRTEGRERLPRRDRAPRARTRSPLFCFFLSKGGPASFSFLSLPSLSGPASLCPFFFRGERASLHPSFPRGRGGTCIPSSLHPSGRGNLHPSPSSGRPASLQPSSPSGEPASLHSSGEEPASLSFLREPRIPPPPHPRIAPLAEKPAPLHPPSPASLLPPGRHVHAAGKARNLVPPKRIGSTAPSAHLPRSGAQAARGRLGSARLR